MSHGRIHDWKMEVESETLKEARENETEDLWGWVNTHGDRVDLKRTEERSGDDLEGYSEENPDAEFGPRYTLMFTAATETSAETIGVDQGVETPLAYGDARGGFGVSEFLKDHGPEGLGYDGLGDFHDNGRSTSSDDEDENGDLKETMKNRLREKYSKDDGDGLDYTAMQKIAGDYGVNPSGKKADELLDAIVEAAVEEQAAPA